MSNKKEWFVQVYDENGCACKFPRHFNGTKEEVIDYIEDRFGLADLMFGRITVPYDANELNFNEDNIPQQIDVNAKFNVR